MAIGVGLAVLGACGATAGGSEHTSNSRVLVVPTERDEHFKTDMQFRLKIPAPSLTERGLEPSPPLNKVVFALDLNGDIPTSTAPTDDRSIVVIVLSVVLHDAIDAALNKRNDRYMGGYDWVWDGSPRYRYGLRYATNTQYPGAPPEEVLFENRKPFSLKIHCLPSGNAYPSLCILTAVGERGGGVDPTANAAVMTEITFRHDRLAEWKTILQHVNAFLHDKLTVQRWQNTRVIKPL